MNEPSPLQVLLVDDEAHSRESLRLLLAEAHPDVSVVAEARDLATARAALASWPSAAGHPDLLFLDIELSGENGFDLVPHLHEDTAIIFVTAYNEYALRAFRAKALDYLLKPIDPAELEEALDRVRERMAERAPSASVEEIVRRIDAEGFRGIAVPSKGGLDVLEADDIIRCASESNYTHLYLRDSRRLVVTRTLKEVEAMLPPGRFARIHHSHLINLRAVRKIWKEDGLVSVEMKDGARCPVSRSRRESFLDRFR